ncbi:MAG TPA: UbiA-like polyprenyltransferase [Nitrospirota bacterium]|nr:UbiA-like polyprenyltransferase [Nitrospirota bacterium]
MLNKVKIILEMIKFEHTIFALPFAFTAALLAAHGMPPWRTVLWIIVAMVGARSAAMGFNRWADRKIDAENPRTKNRALPLGLVSPAHVLLFTFASSVVLVAAAYMLNPLSFALSPVALAIVFVYSFTKRFTFLSHVVLGIAIAGAPLGAWIAVRGTIEAPAVVLALAVVFWLTGFDTLYALQDREFDTKAGLHSIPQRFGVQRSLWIARASHAITMAALFWLAALLHLGWPYLAGVCISLGLIIYEHSLVKENDQSKLDFAFFNMNGYISMTIFIFTLLNFSL